MAATTESFTLIDLAELRADDAFPAYAAVHCDNPDSAFLLSSQVMRWSDRIVLSSLEECRRFWLAQKKKLRCKLSRLFTPLLRHHCGDDYIAVFGDHPWQCLTYLHYQLQQGKHGLYFLHSPIDQNIYKSLGWDSWFEAQSRLAEHLLALNTRGFRVEALLARQAQLRRFVERIGVAAPQALSAADANAMQRRFGKWLALIWRWSFTRQRDLQGFPWRSEQPRPRPEVRRDLEYPLNQWSYIAELLRDDLASLCRQCRRDDGEHINRMTWRITLFNYRKIEVELSFRHPYSLHRDQPGFETALYQARYVYDDVMQKLSARDEDLDLPEQMPFLDWSLEISERIRLAPALWDLFARACDEIDYERVYALQNKLPLAFERYHLQTSFFPEHSFDRSAAGSENCDDLQWYAGASGKPLFYYPQPQPIDAPSAMQQIFLERNANQWWLGDDVLQSLRDYYLIRDHRGRSSWAFRLRDGSWFKQGEFN